MSVFPLLTERLTLRPFTRVDLAAFTSCRRHAEVARYQSWSTWTDEGAEAFLRDQHRLAFDSMRAPGLRRLSTKLRTSGWSVLAPSSTGGTPLTAA